MLHSAVLITTAALIAEANALGGALGYGPGTYTVPLSSDDGETVTHYGAHAWVSDAFVALLIAASGEAPALPDIDWSQHGLTEADVWAVLAGMIASIPGSALASDALTYSDPALHFDAVLAANGLMRAPTA